MPSSAGQSFGGEIIHAAATRLRVTGSGYLRQTLFSLDDVKSKVIAPINLNTLDSREPTKPTNFNSQRICLEFKTTDINEYFDISKIIVFVKPVASGWPGR